MSTADVPGERDIELRRWRGQTLRDQVLEWRERALEAEAERVKLTLSIAMALDELGVPTPDYPAPVVNAVEILRNALDADRDRKRR